MEKEYVDEDDLEICSDVIALFPNIMSRNSGKIVRKTVEKILLQFDGFDWKHGARYIVRNRSMTSDLQELWGVLPYCRKVQGVNPGMTEANINRKKDEDPEYNGFTQTTIPQNIRSD